MKLPDSFTIYYVGWCKNDYVNHIVAGPFVDMEIACSVRDTLNAKEDRHVAVAIQQDFSKGEVLR